MNKTELITRIAKEGAMTKTMAETALNKFLKNIVSAMEKGEKVKLSGFGSFKVVERAEMVGRNPQTGEKIKIPSRNIVRFKAGKNLYGRVQ